MKKELRTLLEQQTNEQLRKIAETAKVIISLRRKKLWIPSQSSFAGLRQAQPDKPKSSEYFRKTEIKRFVSKKVKRSA